ncbi:MAG: hypothetical protein ACI9VM_000056 [Candidatus Azotimanducaceae bacterium]|jgi:hypothetical protein
MTYYEPTERGVRKAIIAAGIAAQQIISFTPSSRRDFPDVAAHHIIRTYYCV